ncbi:MAG: serine/threonine protein kinase [Bryobacteraceae bacterium]|nr:serine/threonine protein kinase [Bryobacteraceae bacterium]
MTVLGRYTIVEQLGAGSMGTVYRALDPMLDREVALKTIRTSGTVDPEVRERFYREARACARLQHPNIVSVFDLGEVDKIAFISMELLRGCDFRKLIERRQALTVAQKIDCMIQVCEALDHAHKHGVIHRDIKPSNLFYQDDGRVKIVDFGIARLPSSRLTIQGNILGTPNYMAPEQILGEPTDSRSDLFSAGLVFFELLVYAHPFQAAMIHKRIVDSDPDSLFDHETSLPVLLDQIMARTLAKKPDDRYGSCGQLANDLRAVLDGIRNNASPSMSRVELPSRRSEIRPEVQIDGDPTLLTPAPSGEDPAEWRLSEVLRLLPEFEEAAERKDQVAAKSKLEELKAIAVTDARFVQAAESCQQTFTGLWGRGISDVVPTRAEVQKQQGDSASNIASAANASAAKANAGNAASLKQASGKGQGDNSAPSAPGISKGLGLNSDQRKVMVGSIAACFLLIAIGWVASGRFASIPEEPSIGTVSVVARRSYIKDVPAEDGKVVVEARQSDSLSLLKLPASRSDRWLQVQARADGKPAKPGYVPVVDVAFWADWTLTSPEAAASLALMMRPADSASVDELRVFLTKLQDLQSRVAGKPQEEQIRTEIASVESSLLQKQPPPEIPAEVPPAEVAAQAPDAEAAKPAIPLTAEQLVSRGRYQLENKYNAGRARFFANEALRLTPNHPGATALLSDIRDYESQIGETPR